MFRRPEAGSYPEYMERYVKQAEEGDLTIILKEQGKKLLEQLSALDQEQSLFRYAPGKWSIKEFVGHLTDSERIFSYRLLRAARNDRTPLPGFNEDLLVENASFDAQPFKGLLKQMAATRAATLLLLESLQEKEWDHKGVFSDVETSALAWACVIAGHERHHAKVLEERYLPKL